MKLNYLIVLLSCSAHATSFKLGIENISESLIEQLRHQSVGLVTNHTGKDQQGRRTVDRLLDYGIPVQVIFAPEHGLHGHVQAGHTVHDEYDETTAIPVRSLYAHGSGKVITQKMLDGCEVIVFDVQDAGMRHYTYVSTLFKLLQAAAAYHKSVVVLDRPNLLGGYVEGPLVEPDLHSFISIAPIPLRYGVTIGELARYFNEQLLGSRVALQVVPMANYHRFAQLPETISHALSPNIPNKQSCHGYSFLGLLGEVRPFDVALGTDKAFQCIMLPDALGVSQQTWFALHKLLQEHGVESSFYSYKSPRKKKPFSGLHIHIPAITTTSSYQLLLKVLRFFKQEGIAVRCSPDFDKAVGTRAVQTWLDRGVIDHKVAEKKCRELHAFFEQVKPLLLYQQLPRVG